MVPVPRMAEPPPGPTPPVHTLSPVAAHGKKAAASGKRAVRHATPPLASGSMGSPRSAKSIVRPQGHSPLVLRMQAGDVLGWKGGEHGVREAQ